MPSFIKGLATATATLEQARTIERALRSDIDRCSCLSKLTTVSVCCSIEHNLLFHQLLLFDFLRPFVKMLLMLRL